MMKPCSLFANPCSCSAAGSIIGSAPFSCWNKIKKGFEKVKSKTLPAIKKGTEFIKNNKDLINAGIDYVAPKLGVKGNIAHDLVNAISNGPSLHELQLLNSNLNSSDDEVYPESVLFPGISQYDFEDLVKESPASAFDFKKLWDEYNKLKDLTQHSQYT